MLPLVFPLVFRLQKSPIQRVPIDDVDGLCPCSGVAASVARLAYQIPEAKKPNQTIIVMTLSLMK